MRDLASHDRSNGPMGQPIGHALGKCLRGLGLRCALVAAFAVLAVVATPWAASAHADLVATDPAAGSVVDSIDEQVRLEFSEVVDVATASVSITGPGGPLPESVARSDPQDAAVILAGFPAQPAVGTYVVRWRVLSIDGHSASGQFRFAYQRASTLLDSPEAEPTPVEVLPVLGRAASAGGTLAVVGLGAFPWLMASRRPGRRLSDPGLADALWVGIRRPLLVGAAVAVLGTAAGLVLTAATSAGVSVATELGSGGDLVKFATGSRTGVLLTVRLVVLVAVGLLALRLAAVGRHVAQPLLCGLGTAALVTFALSSHAAAADVDTWLAVGSYLLHLVAASVWVGGLLGLAFAGMPAARAVSTGQARMADLSAELVERFSIVAQLVMLLVLASGGYMALVQVDALDELGGTTWGLALSMKLALWLTVLVLAAVTAVYTVPALARRTGAVQRRLVAGRDLDSGLRLEMVLAVGLVSLAALLSASPPPATLQGLAAVTDAGREDLRTTSSQGRAAGYVVRVQVLRTGSGAATATVFRVELTAEGTLASAPSASARLAYPDGVDRGLSLALTGEGEWHSERLSVPPGQYVFTARFNRAGEPVAVPVNVEVPR